MGGGIHGYGTYGVAAGKGGAFSGVNDELGMGKGERKGLLSGKQLEFNGWRGIF